MAKNDQKLPHIYCFLDTNILLEFQTFNEVDWSKVLGAKQVCLVLAPIVFRELDKHKTDYNNARRQKRARMLLPKLTQLIEAETDELPQVRRNVTLLALPNEPSIDWAGEHLDPNVNDDRLLASILDFSRQHPSEKVFLLSDDSGPRLKAKSHNVQALAPTGLNRLPEAPSPEEVENRKLKQEIQELTNRLPKLRLGFYENGQVVDKITRSTDSSWFWQTPETYMQTKLAGKREELTQMLARADKTVDESEIQKFKEEYEKYLDDLVPALKMQFIKNHMPHCKLELTLINEGNASAHGVDMRVTFPQGSSIITINSLEDEVDIEDTLPDEPTIPEWAQLPTPQWMKNIISPSVTASLLNFSKSFTYPIISTYTLHKRKSYGSTNFPFDENVISEQVKKLSHYRRWIVDPRVAYLPPNTEKGFTITYEIIADELSNPITGELKILWSQEV